MRKPLTEEDLDSIGGEPSAGEVWWCRGESLRFADGGKVRPVLVVDVTQTGAVVIPMTTRKPNAGAVSVAHQGGHSWLTNTEIDVPRLDLVSSLGRWHSYGVWRRKR
jgi:hypothetical protein